MDVSRRHLASKPWIFPLFGLLSALATFAWTAAAHPFFVVSNRPDHSTSDLASQRSARVYQLQLAERKNAMIVFSIAGSLMAISTVLAAPTDRTMALRMTAGLEWGALWGVMTGYVAALTLSLFTAGRDDAAMVAVGVTQAIAFGLLGCGMGLMAGGLRRMFRQSAKSALVATAAGAISGFCGAILLQVLFASSDGFIADGVTRLIPSRPAAQWLWITIPLVTIAASLTRWQRPDRSSNAPLEP